MRLASLSTVELTCFQQTPGANYLPLGDSNLPAAIAPQLAPERKRGIVIGQKLQCGKLAPGVSPNAVSGRGTSRRPSGQGKGKSLLEERLLSILAGLFGGLTLLLA